VLFVSVDPDRDTPDRIGEYAHAFHRDTLAATADIPALVAFAKSLSLVFMKVPAAEGAPADQYSVDHSAALAVLDPQGRMAGVIPPPLQPKAIAADLITLGRMPTR
jgi:protein SCO1/2